MSSIIANTKGFYFGYDLHNYAQVASAKEGAPGIWGIAEIVLRNHNNYLLFVRSQCRVTKLGVP